MFDKLRKNLLRVASELPKGSDGRKKILALLKESRLDSQLQQEWDNVIKQFSKKWKREGDALDVAIELAADEIGSDDTTGETDQWAVLRLANEMIDYLKKKHPDLKLRR